MDFQDHEPVIIKTQDINRGLEIIIIKKFLYHNQVLQLDSKIEFEVFDKALDSYKGQVQEAEIQKNTNKKLNLEDIYEIMVETIQSHQFNLPNSNLQVIHNEERSFVSFQYDLKICSKNYPIKLRISLERVQIPIQQQLYRSNQKWFNEIEKLKQQRLWIHDKEFVAINPKNMELQQLIIEVNQKISTFKIDIEELKQENQFLRTNMDQCACLKDQIQNLLQWFEDHKSLCISQNENLNDQNVAESSKFNIDNFLKIQLENTTLQQQIEKLNSINLEITETNNNQLQLLKSQNQDLQEQTNSLQKANSQMSDCIKELNEQMENLKNQNTNLIENVNQLNKEKAAIIESKNQEIQQSVQEKSNLQAQITKLNTENAQISQKSQQEIQRLNTQITTLQQQINKLNQDIQQNKQPQSQIVQSMINFLESQISQLNNVNAEITYKSKTHIDGIYQDKERLKSEVSQLISLISYIAQYSTQEIARLRSCK